jgi:hypothetical protein
MVDRTEGKSWHRLGYWLRSEGKTPDLLLAHGIPATLWDNVCRVQPIMTLARLGALCDHRTRFSYVWKGMRRPPEREAVSWAG